MFHHHEHDEEKQLLLELVREGRVAIELDQEILALLKPKLSSIKITFRKGAVMAEGPVTLTVGQSTVASIDGFDQNGAPYQGTIPTPAYSIDQPSFDTITPDGTNPSNEDILSVAVGVANLTATVQGPNGPLTDTETITNVGVAQVLSSIKINFASPAQSQAKKA